MTKFTELDIAELNEVFVRDILDQVQESLNVSSQTKHIKMFMMRRWVFEDKRDCLDAFMELDAMERLSKNYERFKMHAVAKRSAAGILFCKLADNLLDTSFTDTGVLSKHTNEFMAFLYKNNLAAIMYHTGYFAGSIKHLTNFSINTWLIPENIEQEVMQKIPFDINNREGEALVLLIFCIKGFRLKLKDPTIMEIL